MRGAKLEFFAPNLPVNVTPAHGLHRVGWGTTTRGGHIRHYRPSPLPRPRPLAKGVLCWRLGARRGCTQPISRLPLSLSTLVLSLLWLHCWRLCQRRCRQLCQLNVPKLPIATTYFFVTATIDLATATVGKVTWPQRLDMNVNQIAMFRCRHSQPPCALAHVRKPTLVD